MSGALRAMLHRGFPRDDVRKPAGFGENDQRRLFKLTVPEAKTLESGQTELMALVRGSWRPGTSVPGHV